MNAHSKDAPVDLGAALRGVADQQLTRAGQCLGWKAGHRHKGVHQARKSIRRVRSILALVGETLGPGAEALSYLLSEVNQGLSHVRDAQALVEAIDHLAAQTHDGKLLRLLARARKRAVAARRVVLQAAIAADPDFLQARDLLERIKAALDGLAWTGGVSDHEVEAAFSLSKDKTRKAAKKAHKTGDDEDWHRWRRRARRQSQQQRILAEVGIESTVEYDDKEIASLLGQQQDCSLLLEFCESDHSPIRWSDRKQLNGFVEKKLKSLRKALAKKAVDA